jgi:hypothetical protein
MPMRRWFTAVALTAAVTTACSSHATTRNAPTSQTGSTVASSPRSSGSTTPGGVRTVTDTANGTTIALHVGEQLRVVLHSTYWQFDSLPAGGVLTVAAQPSASVDSSCIPGGGCGSQTALYRGAQPGRAVVTASRTTCGEAFACSPAQSRFSITVTVAP